MSSENHTTNIAEEVPGDKGKGKAAEPIAQDTAMDEDEDSSSSDEGEENNEPLAAEEEDGLEEIDLNNIVEGGRRTRGRVIDFAKAAEENPADDDEDEDDDDFKAPEDKDNDKMDTD
ncbi:histone chaperone domain CHZ-domain-containing protein [Plectosphaerella cucumerina]|uniref:Histone chaperone domain CHZ-domain-containing protein n=1 Tax=Plectosphaerella cucumerina TaxID=40658 RepID=A0A8K0X5V9_9PEZI|nr:histone chaperone domain CHZ-domain-containing protein [Plectosphaerella cucumerina]